MSTLYIIEKQLGHVQRYTSQLKKKKKAHTNHELKQLRDKMQSIYESYAVEIQNGAFESSSVDATLSLDLIRFIREDAKHMLKKTKNDFDRELELFNTIYIADRLIELINRVWEPKRGQRKCM